MNYRKNGAILIFLLAMSLLGCGASKEDFASQDPSNYAVSPNTFNVREAWKNLMWTGFSKSLNMSSRENVCAGTVYLLQAPAEVFDATNPLFTYVAKSFIYRNITNCSDATNPQMLSSTQYNYFTNQYLNSYISVGSSFAGGWTNTGYHASFPETAKVGNEGQIGTVQYSGDFTGNEIWSYKLEADTASTALLVVNIKTLDANGNDYSYETYRYTLYPNNILNLRSLTTWTASTGMTFIAR